MTTFAKLRDAERGEASVDCAHNREIEASVDPDLTYIVMPEDVNKRYGIDYDNDGEMLIYSPDFMTEYSCLWVAQTIDFDFFTLEDLTWKD